MVWLASKMLAGNGFVDYITAGAHQEALAGL
jgi:hypothetical protein